MWPARRACIGASTAWMSRNGAIRLMSSAAAKSLGSSASTGRSAKAPALLTSTSGAPPNASVIVTTAAATAAPSARSQLTGRARGPSACASARSVASVRAIMATCAPAACNRRAIARPMPRDAPVTAAVVPVRRPVPASGSGTFVFDVVVLGLPQPQATEPAGRAVTIEHPPAGNDAVLGGGIHATHEFDIDVQIAMVDAVDHFALDDRLELTEVDHVPRALVDGAFDRNLEDVVVTVPVRIIALAEERYVFLVGQCGIVQAVRSIEAQPSRDGNNRHRGDRGRRRTARHGVRGRLSQRMRIRKLAAGTRESPAGVRGAFKGGTKRVF